jgi:hypothetical protein
MVPVLYAIMVLDLKWLKWETEPQVKLERSEVTTSPTASNTALPSGT